MSPILNLPAGWTMVSIRFGGAALPRGAMITFGCANTTGLTPVAIGNLVKTHLRAVNGPFAAVNNHSALATLIDILVKNGPLATGPEGVVGDGAALGPSGGDGYSPATSVLVHKSTAMGGKRYRGRMYVPGLAENGVTTGGALAAGVQADMQARWTEFYNDMFAASLDLALLHRHDPDLGQVPVDPTLLNGLQVQGITASQRRRLRA